MEKQNETQEPYVCQYIPKENEKTIRRLITELLKLDNKHKCRLCINDTEERVYFGTGDDVDEIIKAIDGGDEEIGIILYRSNGKDLWFGVLPYEEPDSIIFDHTANEDAESIFNKVTSE